MLKLHFKGLEKKLEAGLSEIAPQLGMVLDESGVEKIKEYISELRASGLPYDDFLRGKRVMYSEFVKSFDSTDSIANNLLAFFCEDAELLSYADVIESITYDDVCKLFENCFDDERAALSVVKPL